MLDSPFWEEQRALERARERSRTLVTFASVRGLTLPPEAEQRLAQLDAATALLAATHPSKH